MSAALRHRKLRGMTDERWTPMQNLLSRRALRDLGAHVHDIYDIVDGGGDNKKLRCELNDDKCMVRCAQGHSAGSGVRPDCLPVATDLSYIIHGASLESAEMITQTGLPRCQRLHVHFYECDKRGNVLGGNSVRCGSDVGIAVSARQCMDDGIVFIDRRMT